MTHFKRPALWISLAIVPLLMTFQNCGAQFEVADQKLSSSAIESASQTPGACTFNGKMLLNGESVPAYRASSGLTCDMEVRVCTDAVLSGSFQYASCAIRQPAACLINGQTIPHGQSVQAYPASTVSYGSTCTTQTRTCNDGTLSGTAMFATCAVNAPAACLLGTTTVPHGSSVPAFTAATVAFPQSCSSVQQSRTCNNGTLSGTAIHASCTASAPAACSFNGTTVAHGTSIQAFRATTVTWSEACVSETRSCYNGTLSGSAPASTCTRAAPRGCTYGRYTMQHEGYINTSMFWHELAQTPVGYNSHGVGCFLNARRCSDGTVQNVRWFSISDGIMPCGREPMGTPLADRKYYQSGGYSYHGVATGGGAEVPSPFTLSADNWRSVISRGL